MRIEATRKIENAANTLINVLCDLGTQEESDAHTASKQAVRLQFCLGRLADLQRDALAAGGVFAAARVDIAASILETHVRTAADFVERAAAMRGRGATRRLAKRRDTITAVEDAVSAYTEHRQAA